MKTDPKYYRKEELGQLSLNLIQDWNRMSQQARQADWNGDFTRYCVAKVSDDIYCRLSSRLPDMEIAKFIEEELGMPMDGCDETSDMIKLAIWVRNRMLTGTGTDLMGKRNDDSKGMAV